MKEVYRGHEIVMLDGNPRSAIIVERTSGMELPTKITALPDEADQACMRRARRLIDLYLEAPVHVEPEAGSQYQSARRYSRSL